MKTVKTNWNTRQNHRLHALATALALTTSMHAGLVTLPSTWGEYDYKQYLYGGSGNLALSGQSSTGFTALVAANDVDAVTVIASPPSFSKTPDGNIETAGRPTVYQEFPALDLSAIGQKVTATFDLKFNNALVANDQTFRFGLGNPDNNSAFYIKMDSGEGGGDILGFRSDSTTTGTDGLTLMSATFDPNGNLAAAVPLNYPSVGPNGGFVSGCYSHFCNSGGLNVAGSAYPPNIGGNYPNNVGLGVAATLNVVHNITFSMERVAGGLKIAASWGNSAGTEVRTSTYSMPYIDATVAAGGHGSLAKIGYLGFCTSKDDLFGLGATGGSYTVSNFSLDYHAPPVATATYSTSGFTVNTSEDLVLNVSPTVSGNTGSTNIASLTDGQAPNTIPGYDGNNTLNNGVVLTYDLAAAATINEIQTYSAWPGDRYLQDYTVDFSVDGTTWNNGAIAVVNQGTGTLGGWNNVKVSVANSDSSPLAANARYVRFNFNNQQNGAVGYTEIVVNGVSFGLPEAPVFTETPQDQTVTSGETVTFTAQATGFPIPIITWHFIDGSSVDHLLSTVGNTLTFPSSASDAGQYYAVASNEAGTVNSTPHAVLTVNPSIVTNPNFAANASGFSTFPGYFGGANPASATGWTGGSGLGGPLTPAGDPFGPANDSGLTYMFMQRAHTLTQTITTTVGQSYRFSFKAACRQGNVVGLTVWADNTQAPNLIIPDGNLSGTSFQDYSFIFTGIGTQTIQFVNSGTGDFTANVTHVLVTEYSGPPAAPVFTEIPQNRSVIEGESVTFTAQATGSPTPFITWHFIDSGSVDHTLSTVGNTLTFVTRLADAGHYYAVASNSVATVSSTPTAVLTLIPNIVTNGNFAANAADFTQGASYFGGGNPAAATGWTGGSGVNGTLGSAPDYFGPVNHEIPSYLFMQGAKTVTQTITTTAGIGYHFSFKAACRENSVTGLTVWADNTKSPGLTIAIGGLSNTNFQTYSFNFTGSGTQTIQFVSSGTGDFTADLTDVSVSEYSGPPVMPVFTAIPQSRTGTQGDSVTFTAQATGYPDPTIAWHFIDGSSIDHTLSTVGNTLTFTTQLADAGQYYAVASNAAGSVNSTPTAVLTVTQPLTGSLVIPVAATAQSWYGPRPPEAAIDGSGMTPNSPVTASSTANYTPANGTMWLSDNTKQTWITFDLGSVQTITGFHLWNYNELGTGFEVKRGVRTAGIYAGTSLPANGSSYASAGAAWGTLVENMTFEMGTATATYAGKDYAFAAPVTTRYLQLYVTDNFPGADAYTGISEIGFYRLTSPSDPFAAWINGLDWSAFTSPDKTATGDPDGDGMNNQQEFAFGLDPRHGSSVNPITQPLNRSTGIFKYTRTKDSGLTYTYQSSTTLRVPWDDFTPDSEVSDHATPVEEITVTVPSSLLANSKLFLRVKAQ